MVQSTRLKRRQAQREQSPRGDIALADNLIGFGPIRRAYVHSGRRPKPDVGNLTVGTGACAFTGEPAGHARMPPGRRKLLTEHPTVWGYHAPAPGFHGSRHKVAIFSAVCKPNVSRASSAGADRREGWVSRVRQRAAVMLPEAFMLTCSRRLGATLLRFRRWIRRLGTGHSASFQIGDLILGRDVAAALAAMPLFVREAYLLSQVDLLTHAEIARTLGISGREVRRLLVDAVRVLDLHSTDRPADP